MEVILESIPFGIKISNLKLNDMDNLLRRVAKAQMSDELRVHKRYWYAITNTWKTHKPSYLTQRVVDHGNMIEGVMIVDSDAGIILKYLDNGTLNRYATMSDPFTPKTRRGFLGSTPGEGKAEFVNSKIRRPGIESRNWTKTIMEQRHKIYYALFQKRVNKELALYWHKKFSGR